MHTAQGKDISPAGRDLRTGRTGLLRRLGLSALSALLLLAGTAQAAVHPAGVQKLVPKDRTANAWFGHSVSLSADGRTALIGAFGDDNMTGAAYVFRRGADNAWRQETKLTAPEKLPGHSFGYLVSLSADGRTALINALYNKPRVYIFRRTAQGMWMPEAQWEGGSHDQPLALSADGNTAVINSTNKTPLIYTRSAEGKWSRQAELIEECAVDFGASVALSADGQTALVGATGDNLQAGRVYVFARTPDERWARQQYVLSASDPALHDGFGLHVSLNAGGDKAMIVAGGSERNNDKAESVYLFQFADGDVDGYSYIDWFQLAKLELPDVIRPSEVWTMPFSFSADGGTILTGSNGEGGNRPVYLFTGSGGDWTRQELPPPADAGTARFGCSVALSANGNTALVGAPDAAAVYVFTGSAQPRSTSWP